MRGSRGSPPPCTHSQAAVGTPLKPHHLPSTVTWTSHPAPLNTPLPRFLISKAAKMAGALGVGRVGEAAGDPRVGPGTCFSVHSPVGGAAGPSQWTGWLIHTALLLPVWVSSPTWGLNWKFVTEGDSTKVEGAQGPDLWGRRSTLGKGGLVSPGPGQRVTEVPGGLHVGRREGVVRAVQL